MNGHFKLRVARDRLTKDGHRYETMETILVVPGAVHDSDLIGALRLIRSRMEEAGPVEIVWEGKVNVN